MKVITEEGLRYVLKMHFGSDDVNQSICSHLINELQELDTLTVSNLRPMSEVPENEFVLCFVNKEKLFERLIKRPYLRHMTNEDDDWHFAFSLLDGWIPMPVYKPEEMIWPDACG